MKTNTYTNRTEATYAIQSFTKAMSTIRTRYTKEGQADRIIERMFVDKFGDVDISVIMAEYASGKYDVIVGRMRQAEKAHNEARKAATAAKEELLAEMTAQYCGVFA